MNESLSPHQRLVRRIADRFRVYPNVEAIALGGSQSAGVVDQTCDIIFYTTAQTPLDERVALVEELKASRADPNLQFWDLGDEWYDRKTGIAVDVTYWDFPWIEEQLDRVLRRHQASRGRI